MAKTIERPAVLFSKNGELIGEPIPFSEEGGPPYDIKFIYDECAADPKQGKFTGEDGKDVGTDDTGKPPLPAKQKADDVHVQFDVGGGTPWKWAIIGFHFTLKGVQVGPEYTPKSKEAPRWDMDLPPGKTFKKWHWTDKDKKKLGEEHDAPDGANDTHVGDFDVLVTLKDRQKKKEKGEKERRKQQKEKELKGSGRKGGKRGGQS